MKKIKNLLIRFIAITLFSIMLLSISTACTCNGFGGQESSSSTPSVAEETAIDLVKDGKSDYKIVLSKDATNYETYAAEELALYIKEATNCAIDCVTDEGRGFNENDKVISLGETNVLRGSGVKVDYNQLKRDGFVIKRLGNTLILCGGGGYGTLYAVYEFLHQQLDWEAYAVNEIYYKKTPNVKVLDFDFTDKPAIEHRHGGWYASQRDAYFSAKWRTYAGEGGMLFNENAWFYFPHALYRILPPSEYREEHPDWYSNSTSTSQPCFTNEALKAQFIINLKKIILENPGVIFFPFGLEDYPNVLCACDSCLDAISKYKASGMVVRWTNEIVAEIIKWKESEKMDRELYFPVLAYYETKVPPLNDNDEPIDKSCILNEYSPVIYADIEADSYLPYTDKEMEASVNMYSGWLKCSTNNMSYYYTGSFTRNFEWVDNVYAHTENYRLSADFNAMYLLDDASNSTYQGQAFQQMYGYVYAKLKWNPDVDTNALINDYITHYYREAAEEVRSYYYLMKLQVAQQVENSGKKYSFNSNRDFEAFNKGVLEQGLSLLKAGVAKIQNSDAYTDAEKGVYIQRVEAEMLTPLYYILDGFAGSYTKDGYLQRLEEMKTLINKYGITSIKSANNATLPNEQVFEQWRGNKNGG